jgi:hypothetical protein
MNRKKKEKKVKMKKNNYLNNLKKNKNINNIYLNKYNFYKKLIIMIKIINYNLIDKIIYKNKWKK